MSFRLIILSPAEQDITEAFEWYEEQLSGLGKEFVEELDLIFFQIVQTPKIYQEQYKLFRRALLKRFPYKVWYLIDDRTIIVYAVIHGMRHPDRWKKRL